VLSIRSGPAVRLSFKQRVPWGGALFAPSAVTHTATRRRAVQSRHISATRREDSAGAPLDNLIMSVPMIS
jgi:hypothetical protein